MSNPFWQISFWGILGTLTGAFGLIISWLNWRYSQPNIKITYLRLKTSKHNDVFVHSKKDTSPNDLAHYVLKFYLDIKMANKKGGPGAIEKPLLVFKTKRAGFLKKREEIQFEPITKSYSTTRISGSLTETEVTNLGKSFNLKGGEIIDDELEYSISESNGKLHWLVQNYDSGTFYIRYHTNLGEKHEIKVPLTITEH